MSRRALEIGAAIAAWQGQGGQVLFHTLTMRHHRGQRLGLLWDALQGAWTTLAAGKVWKKQAARTGIKGYCRAVETTDGANGWHVHVHALWFVDAGLSPAQIADFGGWAHGKWSRALQRRGLDAPLPVGQDIRLVTGPADTDLAAYLSKSTDLGLELTQSQSKRARAGYGTEPTWELLGRAIATGDLDALDRWHEWETASHGRRQITWSQGLRAALGLGEDRTDDQIAEEQIGDEDLVLITAQGWASLIARPWLIARVLDAADISSLALRDFLAEHEVSYVEPSARLVAA